MHVIAQVKEDIAAHARNTWGTAVTRGSRLVFADCPQASLAMNDLTWLRDSWCKVRLLM